MGSGTLQARGILYKKYSVTPAINANVSPFKTYAQKNISSDVATYGEPIGVVAHARSTNPLSVGLAPSNANFFVWANTEEEVIITIAYFIEGGGN